MFFAQTPVMGNCADHKTIMDIVKKSDYDASLP